MISLRKKFTKTMMFASIIPFTFIAAVSLVGILAISNQFLSDSKATLTGQIQTELQSLATDRASIIDEKLSKIESNTLRIKQNMEYILANENAFPARPVDYLAAKDVGKPVPFLMTAPNTPSVHKDIALVGNIQDTLRQITVADEGITANYIGDKNGYFIGVDKNTSASNLDIAKKYDAREKAWYKSAKDSQKLVWSDIFVDAAGRGLGVSCAAPYQDKNGNFEGVAATGAILTDISKVVNDTKIGKTGFAFLMNAGGNIVIAPDNIEANKKPNFGSDYYVYYAPLKVTQWKVGVVVPVSEVTAPVDAVSKSINQKIVFIMGMFVLCALISVCAIYILSRRFSGKMSIPVTKLSDAVKVIASGDLDTEVKINTGDEIQTLGESVNKMASDLKDYIANLTTVTAERNRIGAELDVAKNIQASMLPHIFPAFPDVDEVDIYATMTPAKEVGGDFYDFFMVGDKVWTVMADVSGKGVPAALFMVIAKTLLKNNAQSGLTPKEVLEVTNNILCENNDAEMFVTVFIGCLDFKTGLYTYASAGHNPPVLQRGEGPWQMMKIKRGLVLAGMENMKYRQEELQLARGDSLYLYTDGVTEAENKNHELFGDPRVVESLNKYKNQEINVILHQMKSEIDAFADGAPQFDDITMLILKYEGDAQ